MRKLTRQIPCAVMFLSGIVLMTLGICRGELREIMQKAVIVCLECIGIG